jgi:hypothetical protein
MSLGTLNHFGAGENHGYEVSFASNYVGASNMHLARAALYIMEGQDGKDALRQAKLDQGAIALPVQDIENKANALSQASNIGKSAQDFINAQLKGGRHT